ncbi:MAG: thiamine-phosphate diphosphorylase [Gammaproteobacteria bacterium RIFOXYA12_FULL_61_12]|nr:MAG: thiamine-phosphate diphosphorylase [Gammaproteobacteria bacterium RIFOXYD12_FULL_61_37]OGT92446.1 MAG: thiamine-phosphate diphosphorylase [Gammaproteobacteria bacterium RIFOXYA12_FULL_61_12]
MALGIFPSHPLHGLYVITDTALCAGHIESRVEQALLGGARVVQYRDKSDDSARRLAEARALAGLCRDHGALLIINDDIELAASSGAHGVHLGREDGACAVARAVLGPEAIIGISCYDDFDRARQARQEGADYIAFGRFFPSQTKPGAVQADPDLLRRGRTELDRPLVAIGGITPENGRSLIAAGAQMLAVIQAVFGAPDIRAACESLTALFIEDDPS